MSAPNYARPAFSGVAQRPLRGARTLEKEDADAKARKLERDEKGAAKKRDGRCRWPEPHKCRGRLEAAHLRDASLGGAMDRRNLIALCAWIHSRGPDSIHGKQLRIDPQTPEGANGALDFYRQDQQGGYYLVRREVRPFEYARD